MSVSRTQASPDTKSVVRQQQQQVVGANTERESVSLQHKRSNQTSRSVNEAELSQKNIMTGRSKLVQSPKQDSSNLFRFASGQKRQITTAKKNFCPKIEVLRDSDTQRKSRKSQLQASTFNYYSLTPKPDRSNPIFEQSLTHRQSFNARDAVSLQDTPPKRAIFDQTAEKHSLKRSISLQELMKNIQNDGQREDENTNPEQQNTEDKTIYNLSTIYSNTHHNNNNSEGEKYLHKIVQEQREEIKNLKQRLYQNELVVFKSGMRDKDIEKKLEFYIQSDSKNKKTIELLIEQLKQMEEVLTEVKEKRQKNNQTDSAFQKLKDKISKLETELLEKDAEILKLTQEVFALRRVAQLETKRKILEATQNEALARDMLMPDAPKNETNYENFQKDVGYQLHSQSVKSTASFGARNTEFKQPVVTLLSPPAAATKQEISFSQDSKSDKSEHQPITGSAMSNLHLREFESQIAGIDQMLQETQSHIVNLGNNEGREALQLRLELLQPQQNFQNNSYAQEVSRNAATVNAHPVFDLLLYLSKSKQGFAESNIIELKNPFSNVNLKQKIMKRFQNLDEVKAFLRTEKEHFLKQNYFTVILGVKEQLSTNIFNEYLLQSLSVVMASLAVKSRTIKKISLRYQERDSSARTIFQETVEATVLQTQNILEFFQNIITRINKPANKQRAAGYSTNVKELLIRVSEQENAGADFARQKKILLGLFATNLLPDANQNAIDSIQHMLAAPANSEHAYLAAQICQSKQRAHLILAVPDSQNKEQGQLENLLTRLKTLVR